MDRMSRIPLAVMNICLDHARTQGGVYVAVNDFARALDAGILDFHGLPTGGSPAEDVGLRYVRIVTDGCVERKHHHIGRRARRLGRDQCLGADLLVCHSLYRAHIGFTMRTAQRLGVPYWAVPHGALDPFVFRGLAWEKRAWMQLIGRRYFRQAERVLFSTKREWQKAAPWLDRNDNVEVVHWPVDISTIVDKAAARAAFRTKHNIPPDHLVLLFLGRLHSMKRPIETIDCFRAAGTQKMTLVIAGMDGDLSGDTLRQQGQERCGDRVRVIGSVFGLAKDQCLCAADAFISLSHRENFGFTTAEALAAGLPVILSDGNDLAAELTDVGCGWLLGPQWQTDCVTALRELERSASDRLAAMGQAGWDWARAHLARQAFESKLAALAAASVDRYGKRGLC